jgi:alpha-beta hydrolase superfamily lysophospholipase
MQFEEFELPASDGKAIRAYRMLPPDEPAAIMLIIHGMAEHAVRYTGFASFLCAKGIAVFSCDLRGHGRTAGSPEACGFIAERNGWMRVADDLVEFLGMIQHENPSVPLFLLGHSMGSFLAQTILADVQHKLRGCILSGTASHPAVLLQFGSLTAALNQFFFGKRRPDKLLHNLSFGAYNKRISKPETKFDWLSRDKETVAQYVADPYCGFVCSAGFYGDLFSGLKFINSRRTINLTDPKLPMLFISGSEDAVGKYGRGMQKVAERYKKTGVTDLTVQLYPGGRHEMLNEINREEVHNDVLDWISRRL